MLFIKQLTQNLAPFPRDSTLLLRWIRLKSKSGDCSLPFWVLLEGATWFDKGELFFSDQSLNNESPHLQQRLRNWNDLNSDLFSLTQCLTRVSVQAVCYRVPPFIKNIIEAHWNVCITPLLWTKNRGRKMWKAVNLSICGKTLLPNKKSQFS